MSDSLNQRLGRLLLAPLASRWRRSMLAGNRSRPEQILRAARKIMTGQTYCFLATVSETGQAHLRVVGPIVVEPDLTIWIGTSAESRKVREIRGGSPVTLGFRSKYGYAAVLGRAEIVTDAESKRERWNWTHWSIFPAGDEDPGYILIRLVPERIEALDFARKVVAAPVGLRCAAIVRKGDDWVRPPDPSP